MTATLFAENLVKRFDVITAVHGVSLEVWPGEIVGLLGPNGSGKTTFLRMLAGILTPTAGSVAVGGLRITEHPITAKRRIGFLSGDTQLYQRLTPREVLRYFGRLFGIAKDSLKNRIDQLVAELEMDAFVDRPCRTLSSGQKQRANLARTFLHQPDVLLLDEPTATLDVISGNFISKTIHRERAAGLAVVLSNGWPDARDMRGNTLPWSDFVRAKALGCVGGDRHLVAAFRAGSWLDLPTCADLRFRCGAGLHSLADSFALLQHLNSRGEQLPSGHDRLAIQPGYARWRLTRAVELDTGRACLDWGGVGAAAQVGSGAVTGFASMAQGIPRPVSSRAPDCRARYSGEGYSLLVCST